MSVFAANENILRPQKYFRNVRRKDWGHVWGWARNFQTGVDFSGEGAKIPLEEKYKCKKVPKNTAKIPMGG